MSYFDINALVDDAFVREKKNNTAYEKILLKIYKRIKTANKLKQYTLIYEVPNYLFGHALYDTRTCIVFLMVSLRKKGIYVKYKNPNILIICWKNALIKNYENKVKQGITVSNNKQSSFNSINVVAPVQQVPKYQHKKIPIKPKTNFNKINENLINSYETPTENRQNSFIPPQISNDRNLDNLIAMSKYL